MARVNNRSALERFVFSYLNKLKYAGNLHGERPYLIKALVLIDSFLGDACCVDPQTVRAYGTRRDNFFTNGIRGILRQEPLRRTVRKSFENAKRLIINKLYNPCCYPAFEVNSSEFVCGGDTQATLTFTGQDSQGTYVINLPATDPYTISFPLIGTYSITFSAPSLIEDTTLYFRNAAGDIIETLFAEAGAGDAVLPSVNVAGWTGVTVECATIGTNPTFRYPTSGTGIVQESSNNATSAMYVLATEENDNPIVYSFQGLPAFATVNNLTHGPLHYAEIVFAPTGPADEGVYEIIATATSGAASTMKSLTMIVGSVPNTYRYTRPYGTGANFVVTEGVPGSSTNLIKTPSGGGYPFASIPYPIYPSGEWGVVAASTGTRIEAFDPTSADVGYYLHFFHIGLSSMTNKNDTGVVKVLVNPA